MRRTALPASLVVLVAAAGCGGGAPGGAPAPAGSGDAAARTGTPSGPKPVVYRAHVFAQDAPTSTESLRGRAVLLTSWASWCAACKDELPALERLYAQRTIPGLEVVAVNVNADGASPMARRMASSLGLTMPVWGDQDNDFTARFAGVGVPTTVLLDRQGRLVRTWQGGIDVTDDATLALLRTTAAAG